MNLKTKDGLSPSQIQELIKYSNTDLLIRNTTSDNFRFKNEATFNDWYAKKRKIYSLVDKKGNLAGIIWFGKKKLPENIKLTNEIDKASFGITFAIRIYEKYRGKGFAKFFMKDAFDLYKQSLEYKNNSSNKFWLFTNSNNITAINAYKNFGFKEIELKDNLGRMLMILEK